MFGQQMTGQLENIYKITGAEITNTLLHFSSLRTYGTQCCIPTIFTNKISLRTVTDFIPAQFYLI